MEPEIHVELVLVLLEPEIHVELVLVLQASLVLELQRWHR